MSWHVIYGFENPNSFRCIWHKIYIFLPQFLHNCMLCYIHANTIHNFREIEHRNNILNYTILGWNMKML